MVKIKKKENIKFLKQSSYVSDFSFSPKGNQ